MRFFVFLASLRQLAVRQVCLQGSSKNSRLLSKAARRNGPSYRHYLLLLRHGKLQVKERRAARTKICNPSSTIPRKRTACLPICSFSMRVFAKIGQVDNPNRSYPISMVPCIVNPDNSSLLSAGNKICYFESSTNIKCFLKNQLSPHIYRSGDKTLFSHFIG